MKAPSSMLLRVLRASTGNAASMTVRIPSHPSLFRQSCLKRRASNPPSPAQQRRLLTTSCRLHHPEARTPNLAPRTRDRGPTSQEDTQTDFGTLNVLGNTPPPATAVDSCLTDGFHLSNGVKITEGSGCLLIGGEAFTWRPWEATVQDKVDARATMLNGKRQWEVSRDAWGLLELVWPKPELLILGTGGALHPLSPETRQQISSMGIRVDISDTRNAAAQFNLLATERGVGTVAAALLPIGWKA